MPEGEQKPSDDLSGSGSDIRERVGRDDAPLPRPPAVPPTLPYYGRAKYGSFVPRGPGGALEFTVGFVAYLSTLGCVYLLLTNPVLGATHSLTTALLPVMVLIGLAIYLVGVRDWGGFVPGVLFGLGLTCLIGIGGIAMICSHG